MISGVLWVTGATSDAIGELARLNGIALHELASHKSTLEQRYIELTADSLDYRTATDTPAAAPK